MRKGRSKESFWARGDRAHNFRLQPAVARVRSLRRLNRLFGGLPRISLLWKHGHGYVVAEAVSASIVPRRP
jgi:hypothetical protein